MKQSREKTSILPVAKKGAMGSHRMTATITEDKHQTKSIARKGDLTMETKTGFAGFDPTPMSENVIKTMKFSLDMAFESIAKIQEFYDKIAKDMIKTNMQIQADAEKVVGALTESSKKGWDEYRKVVEKGFKQAEELVQPTK
jgi:GTP-binding protein EngB required for normal cell division